MCAQTSEQDTKPPHRDAEPWHEHHRDMIPIPLRGDAAFTQAWGTWFEYRAEETGRPIGRRQAGEQLARLAEMGSARAIAAIRYSIGQGYTGIHEQDGRTSDPLSADFFADVPTTEDNVA